MTLADLGVKEVIWGVRPGTVLDGKQYEQWRVQMIAQSINLSPPTKPPAVPPGFAGSAKGKAP